MNVVDIADPSDPRLASYRDLSDAELLRNRGLFVAEGRLVVERVLDDRRYQVESVLVNAPALDALRDSLAGRPDVSVWRCRTEEFARITGFDLHRGCLALVRRLPPLTWADAVGDARVVVILEAVTNADNVGGVFRNAAAFGAGAVLLSPTCCDPLYRKSIRTSMGHALKIPFARLLPWPDVLQDLRKSGFIIAALSPRHPSLTLDEFVSARGGSRVALIVGAEGDGLTAAAERVADVRVRIPIRPEVDSLNLAVATGVALSRLIPGEQ